MYFLLTTALVLVPLYLFLICPGFSHRKEMRPFLGTKWAHRGYHDMKQLIPENSIPAFKRAVANRYGIELDVHLTKDKKVVVFHDDTLRRMCGNDNTVESMTYEHLQEFYLCGTSEKIPLFCEVLRCVNGRVPLLIEIKLPFRDTELCRHVYEELEHYCGPWLIQSFNTLAVRWFKQYAPDVLRGQLASRLTKSDRTPHYFFRFCAQHLLTNCLCRPDFVSYKFQDRDNLGLFLNRRLFGSPTAAWTLRKPADLKTAQQEFDMYIFENF